MWYFAQNPSGRGLAGVVDIVLIWYFSTLNKDNNVSAWLAEKRHIKNIGYCHDVDAKYMHSMGVQYPAAFAGSEKDTILSTKIIAMLKTVKAWRANGMGDGIKEID